MTTPETSNSPAPAAARVGMRPIDWVIGGLISLGALIGISLLALAVVIAAQVWTPPRYQNGVSASDITGVVAAGATILLADFTGLLAWVTRRSIDATQREADIATAALAASNRQAEIAEKALKAAQNQAEIAERQVKATNDQARIAQEQLAASTRPILAEQRQAEFIDVTPDLNQQYGFAVRMVNIGTGPAFVKKALFNLGAAFNATFDIRPKIAAPGGEVVISFAVDPRKGEDIAITNDLLRDSNQLTVGALYHDISGQRAWRSRGKLVKRGTNQWLLVDVDVADIELTFLD